MRTESWCQPSGALCAAGPTTTGRNVHHSERQAQSISTECLPGRLCREKNIAPSSTKHKISGDCCMPGIYQPMTKPPCSKSLLVTLNGGVRRSCGIARFCDVKNFAVDSPAFPRTWRFFGYCSGLHDAVICDEGLLCPGGDLLCTLWCDTVYHIDGFLSLHQAC